MSIKIEVQTNRAGALAAALQDALSRAVRETALAIEADAKQRAPVDTGALRNSIQADTSRAASALESEVTVGMEYGPHVEFGTVNQAAQPYLTPAVEGQRAPFVRRVEDAINKAA